MIEDPDITQRKSSRSPGKSGAVHDKRGIKKTRKECRGDFCSQLLSTIFLLYFKEKLLSVLLFRSSISVWEFLRSLFGDSSQDQMSRRRSLRHDQKRLDKQNKNSNCKGLVTNERTDLYEKNSQRRSCSGLNDQNEKFMVVKKTNPAEKSSRRSLRHSKIIFVDENYKTSKDNSLRLTCIVLVSFLYM
jgi:hypothetical protein